MLSSCRGIAEATTLLLKTVYGAEIRRFFETSERAREALEKSKAYLDQLAQGNPQPFANSASEVKTNNVII